MSKNLSRLTFYEALVVEAEKLGLEIVEKKLSPNLKGLYFNDAILLNSCISSKAEKHCILAEEIGHHVLTAGDILDQCSISNRKQELNARVWSYEKLVSFDKLVSAYEMAISSKFELIEYLNITEPFLDSAIAHYNSKYGLYRKYKNYIIYFNPFGILDLFKK